MNNITSYFTLVCFVGIRLYSVKAENRKEAAREGMIKIINDKYRSGRFFKYDDFPILVAVQENPESVRGPVITLYKTEIEKKAKEDRIKEVKALEEVEPFLRSAFRGIRNEIHDINDFKKNIEVIMTEMIEEMRRARMEFTL